MSIEESVKAAIEWYKENYGIEPDAIWPNIPAYEELMDSSEVVQPGKQSNEVFPTINGLKILDPTLPLPGHTFKVINVYEKLGLLDIN